MFSGIVEAAVPILRVEDRPGVVEIAVQRPDEFSDIAIGDSMALNGVCLTIERLTDGEMVFALGPETLSVTGWTKPHLLHMEVNLERSLRMGERLHGHMVSGHVDAFGEVTLSQPDGESWFLRVRFPHRLKPYIWPKGSVAIDGVSLTVNQVEGDAFTVCLIPETIKRTNLKQLNPGDTVNLETDLMARGIVNWLEQQGPDRWI